MAMTSLQGKVAVVTGAASGIGRAIADKAAAEGMRLMLADIDVEGVDALGEEMRHHGVDVVTRPLDVSEASQIEALAAATLDVFGTAHLVCNNAGIGAGGAFTDVKVQEWEHVLAVDLWSVIHGMRVFLPILVAQDEGHIVNTASVAGLYAPPFMGPYNVAKYGVVAASETVAAELTSSGSQVGISVLCPSWVRTNIHKAVRQRLEAGAAAGEAAAESGAFMADMLDGFIETGKDPADVADLVFEGVRTDRFYLLTHGDTTKAFDARARAVASGDRPPITLPDQA